MTSPRYARATTASTLKTRSNPTKVASIDDQKSHVLKRPSTLTPAKRSRISYLQDLVPIKPRNRSQPCHLANLPSELRLEIYKSVMLDGVLRFPQVSHLEQKWKRSIKYIWPPLLHICRAIRIEAAYIYYTSAPFSWHLRNLDFTAVTMWVDKLPREHRALLVRNKNITLDVLPSFADDLTYPPSGYLIDDYQEAHWKRCEPFGNLYSLRRDEYRKHFIAFCRLASWWSWCSKRVYRDIEWNYTFGDCQTVVVRYGGVSMERQLNRFMLAAVMSIPAPYVARAWTRRRTDIKRKAWEWVAALDQWWEKHANRAQADEQTDWRRRVALVKKAVESW